MCTLQDWCTQQAGKAQPSIPWCTQSLGRRRETAIWQNAKERRQAWDQEWAGWPSKCLMSWGSRQVLSSVRILTDRHCHLECHPEKISDAQPELNGKECWNCLLMSPQTWEWEGGKSVKKLIIVGTAGESGLTLSQWRAIKVFWGSRWKQWHSESGGLRPFWCLSGGWTKPWERRWTEGTQKRQLKWAGCKEIRSRWRLQL